MHVYISEKYVMFNIKYLFIYINYMNINLDM